VVHAKGVFIGSHAMLHGEGDALRETGDYFARGRLALGTSINVFVYEVSEGRFQLGRGGRRIRNVGIEE